MIDELLRREYGIEATTSRLAGESDNYLVTGDDGERWVLKLAHTAQPGEFLDLEHLAVETLARSLPDLRLPRTVLTRRGTVAATGTAEGLPDVGQGNAAGRGSREPTPDPAPVRARLLRFVDGMPWCEAGAPSSSLRADLGRVLAAIGTALEPLEHPAARRTHRWDLARAEVWRPKLTLIEDPALRGVVERGFFAFAAGARPFLDDLPHSIIHGDLNDENLLVEGDRIVGLLDFGDCIYNPTICELAISLTYVLLYEDQPLAAGGEIVAAYHADRPLQSSEIEVLYPLICGRLAASLTIAAERRRIDPERSAWFVTEERAARALRHWVEIDPLTAAEALAAGTGVEPFPDGGAPRRELIERRRRHVSGALSLSYSEPLKISRGRGPFLFDDRQRPYLDLYNNVCHVGHCHPRVVEAGRLQMERLNTNTRYLYDGLVAYAERLCATLPEPLQYCFFVNSGSEANELALRLARTHTGRRDMLVVDAAYHGHTTTMIDISPYKLMGRGGPGEVPEWVHVVPIPDGYRGPHKGPGRDAGGAYGEEAGRVAASVEAGIAGFIGESLPSCGGQIIPPEGWLQTAFAHVRAAGGVCIVDEVQVGFGRVGTRFWGFELQEVVPDIVVMGKPIGNGHPMAAVVTTEEIAASFAGAGMEFFSTFGGNPVSCAVGMAVLDVVRDEGLQQNALEVGTRLRDGLRGLMERHDLIGDVRGAGLFIGVELVEDRDTLEPATVKAAALVDALRRLGVLTGTDGPHHNVVKIKGPLVLSASDADMAVAAFDDALSALSTG